MNSENNNNNILYMGKGIDKNKYKTKPKIQRGGDNEFTSTATNITSRIGKIGYDIRIFSFLAVMGILIRMIFAEKSKDYATATMYGYSASLLALLGLLVTSVGMTYKQPNTNSHLEFIKVILKTAMPVILLGIIIGLIAVLLLLLSAPSVKFFFIDSIKEKDFGFKHFRIGVFFEKFLRRKKSR